MIDGPFCDNRPLSGEVRWDNCSAGHRTVNTGSGPYERLIPSNTMPRRRITCWIALKNGLLVLAALVFLFMSVSPVLESFIPVSIQTARRLEIARTHVMEGVLAIWFLAFGSMVGSFMNVVVWRMPRGVSVVSKGSACPWCCTPIRLSDNIPVFGWIKLGGRCRVCRLPIAARYPIVEAVWGISFLILFLAIIPTGGRILPGEPLTHGVGIVHMLITTKWPVVGLFFWLATLFTLLAGWALMELDGSRIPVKMIVFGLVVGFAAPVAFPWLHRLSWMPEAGAAGQWSASAPIATGFVGLVAGFLAGEFLDQFRPRRGAETTPGYFRTGLMTIGLFVGWQGLAVTVLIAGLVLVALSLSGLSKWRTVVAPTMSLPLGVLVQVMTWRLFDTMIQGWSGGRMVWYPTVLLTGLTLIAISLRSLPATHPAEDRFPPQSTAEQNGPTGDAAGIHQEPESGETETT